MDRRRRPLNEGYQPAKIKGKNGIMPKPILEYGYSPSPSEKPPKSPINVNVNDKEKVNTK